MLRYFLFYGLTHFEICCVKELLDRSFKQVDIVHAIHKHHLRLVPIYIHEDCVHAAGIYVVLV